MTLKLKSKASRRFLPAKKPNTAKNSTKNNVVRAAARCFAWLYAALASLPLQGYLNSSLYAQAGGEVERSGAVFKNVTALAEMPADQMGKVMNIMSASLGVNCQFCHAGFDFPKEHVAHKDLGRKMIEMTLELNAKYFEGRNEVTCFTCHRGQSHPLSSVISEPRVATKQVTQPDVKPTVDELYRKHVAALGGQARLAAIKNRHIVAKRIEPDGRSEPEEIWQSNDGAYRLATTYKTVVVTEAYDGKAATKKANEDTIKLKMDEALQIEREAKLSFPAGIEATFEQFSFTRIEEIEDRRVVLLSASGSNDIREQLYLDEQTSLLTRRTATVPTVLGDFVYQVDYQKYKVFDGIQIPTLIRYSVPNITWIREVISVEH
jgi:Photosynthetic reaction centre cytochrome C subunit